MTQMLVRHALRATRIAWGCRAGCAASRHSSGTMRPSARSQARALSSAPSALPTASPGPVAHASSGVSTTPAAAADAAAATDGAPNPEAMATSPPLQETSSMGESGDAPLVPVDGAEVIVDAGLSASSDTIAATAVAGDVAASAGGDAAASAVTAAASSSWSETLLQPAMVFINTVHDASGLPWWASIGLATLMVRTLMLPVSVFTMRSSSKMAAVQDDLKQMREGILEAMRSGNRSLAEKKQAEQKEFMRAAGVSPGRVLVGPFAQFPVFISFFVGIRRLAEQNPELATGGLVWFTDLSSKDPFYALPALAGVTLLGMTELGGDTGAKMTSQMRNVMRGMAVLSVPMTSWLPTAVFCYWIPNNIFSIALSGAMRSPEVKKRLGLAVDPASIPGSSAAAKAARLGALQGRDTVSASDAAASYMRKHVKTPGITSAAGDGKPILLKNKPRKKKNVSPDAESESIAA